jgi:hypothetical protein
MTSPVAVVILNSLISLTSPVASSVLRRFVSNLQHIDIVTSPVLAGPLSGNPLYPLYPHSPRGTAWGGPKGLFERPAGLSFRAPRASPVLHSWWRR